MPYTEQQRKYHRDYYRIRRQRLLDYLGGVCAVCGSDEDLQFDHLDPAQKSFEIKANLTLNETTKLELDKCQLLCTVHHAAKTAKENSGFEHGTVYSFMKKKCGCDICNRAKWAWNDDRNKRRRTGPGYNVVHRRAGETR